MEIMIEKLWQAISNVYKHLLRQGQTSSKRCRLRNAAKEAASLRAEQRPKIALYDFLSGNAGEGGEQNKLTLDGQNCVCFGL
jgi:hypothetical protein